MDLATVDDATARPLLMALCAVLRDVYGDSAHDVLVAEAGRRVGLHDPSTDGGTVGGMSNNDKPGHPDCHECGGTGTNASGLPCFACHRKANLAARRHPVSDSVVLVNASGSKYAAFVEAIADGDLPGGLLATTGQPGPYSAAAVDATVDHLHQRIRELEADAIALRRERDDLRDAARAVVWAKVRPCYICNRVSTVTDRDDAFCEGHAHLAGVDKRDAPDAPAWRRLCALVAT